MNKIALSLVMCLMALTNPIWAEDKLDITDFIITPGISDKEFSIALNNDITYAAFQFDLYLPNGLTISDYTPNRSRLPENTTLHMEQQADGSYRFIAVANNLTNISGSQGNIITIKVSASDNAEFGRLTGAFKNIKLSKANGFGSSYEKMDFPITIVEPSIIKVRNCTREYGEPNPKFEYFIEGGEIFGEPIISCNATETSPIGSYPITINKGTIKNDVVTFINDSALTIIKAPLNIAAGQYIKKQGDAMPDLTLTYTGFKNYDNKDVLTKQPTVVCDVNEATAPGEYPVTVSGAEAINYDISYTNGKLVVVDATPVIITAKSYTRQYGEDNPVLEFTSEGVAVDGIPEITCEASATSPVGTYDIVVKQGTVKNYNVTYVPGTLTIEKAPLTIATSEYTKKQGDPMPDFTLSYTGFQNNETKDVLTKQPIITCNATEASEPGIYPIIVSGAEATNYNISYTNGQLTVIDADKVSIIAKNYTREYGDDNPTFEFTTEGATLYGTPEIVCEATATSPVGTYDIIVKQGSVKNYNVEYVAGKLTITKAHLNIAADTYIKKQGEEMPDFNLIYTGFKNSDTKDVLTKQPIVVCNANEASKPGEYTITVSGAEARNYDINYTDGKLIVTEADLIIVSVKNYTRKYGDANPTFGFTAEGGTLNGKPEITCEATEASPVGTYDIVITQGTVSNYNVQYVAGTLTIEKAPLTISTGTYTKKQGDPMPEFELKYKGFKNNENKDVLTKQASIICNADEASEPDEYPIIISGAEASNYEIIYEQGRLFVVDADPVIIIAKNYSRNYGDSNPIFEYTIEGDLDGVPEISCEATATSPVGEYDIVLKPGSVKSFNVTYITGKLTIDKAPLNIKAGTYSKKQGEDMPEFLLTYEGFKNNETKDVLTKQPVVTCNADITSIPGNYPVRVSGAEARNYEISYTNGKLIVSQADPVTITVKSYTRIYGDNNPEFEFTSEGAVLDGIPEIVCEATPTSPVGTYDIIVKKGSVKNYNVTYVSGTLTITKAPLNIAADIYTKKQGDSMPNFILNYTGFKNNDTKDILTKLPSIVCEANEASMPGEYPIIVSGAEATNYQINYTNGLLIVTEADAVIVKAKSYTRQYGDENPTFDFITEGATLDGSPEIVCEATTTSPVGTYDIIIKQGSVKNYNVTYIKGTLTIDKAPLNIAADTYIKKQGDPMPEFTLSYTGFKNNETEDILTKPAIVTCYANETSKPGEYPVRLSGAEGLNYNISYTHGKLIVMEADAIVVKANNYTRLYGDPNPAFDYMIEGGNLDGTPEIVCEATATSPVGTYDIIVKQGTIKNFNVTYVAGTLTIEKAPLNIAAGSYQKKQGEEMPTFVPIYTGFKNGETKDVLTKWPIFECEANEVSGPGEYTVKVSGAEGRNYNISYTDGNLIVTEADAVTIKVLSYTRKYGEENPVFDFETEGVTLEGTPIIQCEATATSPVGVYDIIVKPGSVKNFNVIYVAGKLTIEKAPLSIAAGTYIKKQGDPMPEFTLTYKGFKNDETKNNLTKLPTIECEANEGSAPGEYEVIVSGAESSNYDISYTNGKLIVVKANPVIIKVKDVVRLYGDDNPSFEFTTEGDKLIGLPEISCEASVMSPVGTYEIIIKQGSVKNYNVTFVSGTLTIERAPLVVTVGDYTREQGQDNPSFELSYYGWKNGESEDVLIKKPIASTNATKESPVGNYLISISGGESQNYEFSYSNGVLTVIKANEIIFTQANEQRITVFTTTGKKINTSSLKTLPRGIYIVNGKKTVVK